MNLAKAVKNFTVFEKSLWVMSVIAIIIPVIISGSDVLTLAASLIGVTALIFVAKGNPIGQVFTIIFAVFYGIISVKCKYYGEMITYLFMTSPAAVAALVQWLKHPYKKGEEVEVAKLGKKQIIYMFVLTCTVTAAFYFVLKFMGNESLVFSTFSVTTSFLASYLTVCRSEYYALAYAANDIVLIVLWIIASLKNNSFIPMVICFAVFLINDMYGFFNWQRMKLKQKN